MRIGSGVNAVDCLGGDRNRGVESKGLVGAADVVVDRLRNADAGHAVLAQKESHRLCVIATQCNQGVNIVRLQHLPNLVDAARNLLYVGARRVQNRSALQLDAIDPFQRQRNPLIVERTPPVFRKLTETHRHKF